MVYAQQRRILDIGESSPATAPSAAPLEFSSLLDPNLLQAAQQIYRDYYEVHPEQIQRPIGVAIDRTTYRGQLIFGRKPILLPHECFLPMTQVDLEL